MRNIRYPILLILLLLGKDLLREVARIPIDNVDCVPVEIKHLWDLGQRVVIRVHRQQILSEDGLFLSREPGRLVAVVLDGISCHGHYGYQTYDDSRRDDTGPCALKPGLRVLIALCQGHTYAGPLPHKTAINLGMMIVGREIVEEAIDCFKLAIHEPVVVMLLAALGQAKAHATHANQVWDVRIHHHEVCYIPVVLLASAIVT